MAHFLHIEFKMFNLNHLKNMKINNETALKEIEQKNEFKKSFYLEILPQYVEGDEFVWQVDESDFESVIEENKKELERFGHKITPIHRDYDLSFIYEGIELGLYYEGISLDENEMDEFKQECKKRYIELTCRKYNCTYYIDYRNGDICYFPRID